jgi:hypothetical protein
MPFLSSPTRLLASDANAIWRPSRETDGLPLAPLAWKPADEVETRSVRPVRQSCTNTSATPFVSPGTRLVASLTNATQRPSGEIAGSPL